MKTDLRHKIPGQSLTEVALAGSLIGLVSISALVLLGHHTQGLIHGASDITTSTSDLLQPIQGNVAVAGTNPVISVPIPSPIVAPGIVPINVSTVSATPSQDMNAMIQTVGANGATTVLADNIETLAKQKLDSGEISQDQYNQLIGLAKQGHHMAEIQAAVEALNKNPDVNASTYNGTLITVDGKTATVADFGKSLGFNIPSGVPLTDVLQGSSVANAETAAFIKLYNSATASLSPAMKDQIKTLGSDILILSDTVAAASDYRTYDAVTAADMMAHMQDRINYYGNPVIINDNATATHADASHICTTGNGSDSGQTCTP
jgi:hypothetical protein